MEHLAKLLQEHFRNHPGMELRDAIKFLYQSSMGGGHLIADPCGALARLEEEWDRTDGNPALPPTEPLGGALCRLSLAACKGLGLAPSTVLALFHRIADVKCRKIKPASEIRVGLLEICKINLQIGVVFHLYFFCLLHLGLFYHYLLPDGIIFAFRLLLRQIGIQTHSSGDQNCSRQYCGNGIFHFFILHACPLFSVFCICLNLLMIITYF